MAGVTARMLISIAAGKMTGEKQKAFFCERALNNFHLKADH